MTLLGNFYDATMQLVLEQFSEIASGDIIFIGLQRNDQVRCADSSSYLPIFISAVNYDMRCVDNNFVSFSTYMSSFFNCAR